VFGLVFAKSTSLDANYLACLSYQPKYTGEDFVPSHLVIQPQYWYHSSRSIVASGPMPHGLSSDSPLGVSLKGENGGISLLAGVNAPVVLTGTSRRPPRCSGLDDFIMSSALA